MDPRGYQALELIYDTAVNPGSWRRALDATATAVEAKAIALVIRGKKAGAKDLTMMSSVYLDFSRTPAGWYYGAWLSRMQNQDWDFLKAHPPHEPVPDLETGLSAEAIDARKDYAFLRKRTGVARRLGVRLSADSVWFDAMSIGFDRQKVEIPLSAIERSRAFLPHLTKALEIGRVFAFLKARYNAALAALERVQAGIAIALPDGQVIVKNGEAERILGLKDGIVLSGDGRIVTSNPDTTSKIQAHILDVGSTAQGKANRHESLVSIVRPSGLTPFLIDIGPVNDSKAELEKGLNGALVTIIDPERIPYLRLDRFTELYGLTGAETDVCRWITDGASISEIAERRGTSPTTAKNQVSNVLSKVGVGSRIELIRLILRVLPPVA
ncbi:LuxR C-terminal-related transcriptional regulator [Tropicimonas sp. TH_r6]|uniref:helix-turn-helix transcriptional regulator n=1 Tax=Tropicimonas sp. TH_r6 TaxID=3082085 RepID=UPI002953E959|nr:LuxR C-terminal-related transcriptional regulator [Tropicimonas sp. TH_r6]MDV7145989.1 LuxR C-terminal-related transcriptional regulator [Tropicimonas sp. TH_r6]